MSENQEKAIDYNIWPHAAKFKERSTRCSGKAVLLGQSKLKKRFQQFQKFIFQIWNHFRNRPRKAALSSTVNDPIVSQLKQPTLFKDNFHPFKPPRHGQMVICEVEWLDGPICQYGISHFWTTWMWSPTQLWIFHHLVSTQCIQCSFPVQCSVIKQK